MRGTHVLSALILGLAASAAHADEPRFVKRDAACKPVAKIDFLDCQTDVVYECPEVPGIKGKLWREELFDGNGLSEIDTSTADGMVVEGVSTDGSFMMTADPAKDKTTPMAQVLSSGKGVFSSQLAMVLNGKPGKGKMTLEVSSDNRSVKLGGLTAQVYQGHQVTDYPDPVGTLESTFLVYLFPDAGMIISGERTGGPAFKADETPHRLMSLELPGSDGFDKTIPTFCGEKSS